MQVRSWQIRKVWNTSISTYRLGVKEMGLKDGLPRSKSGDKVQVSVVSGGLDTQRSFGKIIGSAVGGGIFRSREMAVWVGLGRYL